MSSGTFRPARRAARITPRANGSLAQTIAQGGSNVSVSSSANPSVSGAAVTFKTYGHVNHALMVGSLAWPLTAFAPVLDDTVAFMRGAAPRVVAP